MHSATQPDVSRRYEPGPYSEVEGDVDGFVTWYINRVRAHLAS